MVAFEARVGHLVALQSSQPCSLVSHRSHGKSRPTSEDIVPTIYSNQIPPIYLHWPPRDNLEDEKLEGDEDFEEENFEEEEENFEGDEDFEEDKDFGEDENFEEFWGNENYEGYENSEMRTFRGDENFEENSQVALEFGISL